MDDDVQYLGTKLAQPEPLSDPCEAREAVSGMSPLSFFLGDAYPLQTDRDHLACRKVRREARPSNYILPCSLKLRQHRTQIGLWR